MPENEINQEYVGERVVHQITSLSLAKLRKDRARKEGVPYIKLGRTVRYFLPDVFKYMEDRRIETK